MRNAGFKFKVLAIGAAMAIALQCGSMNLAAQNVPKAITISLPPMGWSSWNSFSNTVDSRVIVNQAKAMISTGMHKAGYNYINIDEGWWLGKRDEHGNIVVDPKAWPTLANGERDGDMANIVRYIHSLGLKAGIYTDAGLNGCGTFFPDIGPGYPGEGSEGHYEQDFLQFAKWGFDYVKVDWCGGNKENLDPAFQYGEIARAINRAEAITGHRLYYSLCEWGKQSPWNWAPNVGGAPADIWRTSGDIVDPIVANSKDASRRASFKKVLSNFDQGIHPDAQHTGFYNDPDMMVIGMPGLTDAENRAHMSLWAIAGAPTLVGADLTQLSDAALSTLINPAVLAIDQDALGLQAVKVHEDATGLEVWSKRLATSGERAVLLLNRADATTSVVVSPITVSWTDIGLEAASARVKDPWTGKDLGAFDGHYAATVQRGDAVLLVVSGEEAKSTRILPAPASKPGKSSNLATAREVAFRFNASTCGPSVDAIQIVYKNSSPAPRTAELRVNGQDATRVLFPATGTAEGSIWVQATLNSDEAKENGGNRINISSSSAPALQIESILLHVNKICEAGAPNRP